MRASKCCAAVLAGVVGMVTGEAAAAETNPSPRQAPLIKQDIKTIAFCRDKTSAFPDSAYNSFSPISAEFMQQIGKSYSGTIQEASQYKVTLLQPPKHGQAQLVYEPSQHWTYAPEKGYVGADRAIYLVEGEGK